MGVGTAFPSPSGVGREKRGRAMTRILQTSFWIMVITLVSKFLGFLRETAIAKYFGATSEADAFFVAFSIPGVLLATVVAAVGTTFIPVYERLNGNKRDRYLANLTNIVGLFSLLLFVVSYLFAGPLVRLFAPGFPEDTFALAVRLERIFLLSVLFLGYTALFSAYLQVKGKFLFPAAVGIPFNLILVGTLFAVGSRLDIVGFMWIAVVATFSQFLLVAFPLLRVGYPYRPLLDFREEGFRQTLVLFSPVVIGTAASQVAVMVDRMLASGLPAGSVSALNYANKLMQFTYGVLATSLFVVLFPHFTRIAAREGTEELSRTLRRTLEGLLLFLLPVTAGSVVLALPVVQVLFERGVFTREATTITAPLFALFSLGLFGLSLRDLWMRAFYALQDTRTPMWNSVFSVALNIALNLLLVGPLGAQGLALSTSVSFTVAAFLLHRDLARRIGQLWDANLRAASFRAVLATGGLTLALLPVPYVFPYDTRFFVRILLLLAVIASGAALYAFLLYVLGDPTVRRVVEHGRSRIFALRGKSPREMWESGKRLFLERLRN